MLYIRYQYKLTVDTLKPMFLSKTMFYTAKKNYTQGVICTEDTINNTRYGRTCITSDLQHMHNKRNDGMAI